MKLLHGWEGKTDEKSDAGIRSTDIYPRKKQKHTQKKKPTTVQGKKYL